MPHVLKTLLFGLLLSSSFIGASQPLPPAGNTDVPEAHTTFRLFSALFVPNNPKQQDILHYLSEHWTEAYLPLLIDVLYHSKAAVNRQPVIQLMEQQTGQRFGGNINAWLEWLWNQEQRILPYHGDWMARVHKGIDPKFERYFKGRTQQSKIRLDEVRWGGVVQDGIPPLRYPKMLKAEQANYLADHHVVFGVSINGDHRAYPKRILAWHEMFVDTIGGASIAGVYCTLCGTVIAYDTEFEGTNYQLGTSGFLYRSNKLMYDQATQSLWNTIAGKPVIGPLADSDIELSSHAVVTTTWGAWKALHPDTQVLSLETGHQRNYGEGEAYKSYFATDDLMFNVPSLDGRLANKDEVLIVRAEGYQEDPLALSARFLARRRVYQDRIRSTNFVVLTDKSGGNRVYHAREYTFTKLSKGKLLDATGASWDISEEQLVSPTGEALERLPYHRIFWFAWYNSYPETRLVR
ncbi:MAG: DUF3179 domain-containing protein [Bacteroidota bacterium]